MNPNPQAVTERYISNLLHNGRNKEFDLEQVIMHDNVVEGVVVGYYFKARVLSKTAAENGLGPTPTFAVRQALTKHGVTFR